MKLKISQQTETKLKAPITCVDWNNAEEAFFCGDDRILMKRNLESGESSIILTLPDNVYPTRLQPHPKLIGNNSKQAQEIILLATADGKFFLINQNGKIEKSVSAHRGACLACQWSADGSGFLTGGEDGMLRVWSRGGLPRSTVASIGVPIYSAVWGPNGSSVLYSHSNKLAITYLQNNNKIMQWKGHDGLILSVSWNSTNNLILSGAEDGTYKIWDTFGQVLFSSSKEDSPIMAVSWSPTGELFSVAGYNLLRLCDSTGWSHCLERPRTGSIQNVAWSPDGTQLAAACSNSQLLFAHIIEKKIDWTKYSCSLTGRKTILVADVEYGTTEQLDFPSRVIQMTVGHGHMIVVTPKQCFIHSSISWNTPVIFDLKEGIVYLALVAEKCFCLVEHTGVNVYSFLGRLITSPKWASMRLDTLSRSHVTLGPDFLAVIDQNDAKTVHLFELPTGIAVRSTTDQSTTSITHKMPISEILLSQSGPISQRQLALVDFNKDLYLISVKESKMKFNKIAVQVKGITWCEDASILIGLREGKLVVFGSPRTPAFYSITTINRDVSDLGKNPTLLRAEEGCVTIRRSDGSLLHVSISPFPMQLAKKVAANQWSLALKLCRIVKDETLWACLAALAWEHRELDVAEEAFAVIKQPHQVEYIQQLKNPNLKDIQCF